MIRKGMTIIYSAHIDYNKQVRTEVMYAIGKNVDVDVIIVQK